MNWYSVAEISRITRIPAPTARRYASLFKDFLPSRKVGRVTKYPEDAVAVFERIMNLYNDGHVTAEIEDVLRQEMQRTIEVEPVETAAAPATAPFSHEHVAMSARFSELMDKMGDCLDVIADQKTLIESQAEDIRKLKTAFVLLARSQKRMKALPAESFDNFTKQVDDRTRALVAKDQELETVCQSLSGEQQDVRAKLAVLESELVRLRKDRREMEQYLQDKIRRLRNKSGLA